MKPRKIETTIADKRPDLIDEWDYEKNGIYTPYNVAVCSNKKFWWHCKNGHSWMATANDRTRKNSSCPYCARSRYLRGFNDFETLYPDLAKQWDYEKNGDKKPGDYTPAAGDKVWWKCEKGHSWYASIRCRTNGNGCPFCSHRRLLRGYNDLATTNPELAKEWDYEKNGNLTPRDLMAGSHIKVHWICSKGHTWVVAPADRNAKNEKCPYCSGARVLRGYNDFETLHPDLAKQWDYEKNGNLMPYDVSPSSNKKVWWKCEKGHSYLTSVGVRHKGFGCPYCSGQRVLAGFNDLATTNPELVKEWDYAKNGDLKPEQFTHGCPKKVWWKCKNGHSWKATIANRSNGSGCPKCNDRKSLPEYILEYYLSRFFKIKASYKPKWLRKKGREIDVYIPELKLGIEYDGVYFHSKKINIKRDSDKNKICSENGIDLIRIREKGCPELEKDNVYIIKTGNVLKGNYEYMNDVLKEIEKYINKKYNKQICLDANIKRDINDIRNFKRKQLEN